MGRGRGRGRVRGVGRGRGAGRGRGSTGGRQSGRSGCTPSTLPWQVMDLRTDTCLTHTFTPSTNTTPNLTASAAPVEFIDHFLDSEVLHHLQQETNK